MLYNHTFTSISKTLIFWTDLYIIPSHAHNTHIYVHHITPHTPHLCTPHTHTIHPPLKAHIQYIHNHITYKNTPQIPPPTITTLLCHMNASHTHTHTHTLLSRSVAWLLPPKQTKCVSPAIISIHEFFTSWNRGVAGSGRPIAGTWGKGSPPSLSCLTHTH